MEYTAMFTAVTLISYITCALSFIYKNVKRYFYTRVPYMADDMKEIEEHAHNWTQRIPLRGWCVGQSSRHGYV